MRKIIIIFVLGFLSTGFFAPNFFSHGAALFANPFYTPEHSKNEQTENTQDILEISPHNKNTPEKNKDQAKILPAPVRITGASPELIKKQGSLRTQLGDLFYNWNTAGKTEKSALLWVVLWISFSYGVFHGSGPGHRKTIVFSFYLTKKAPWWEPALTAFALALLHGGTAVLIMLLFKGITGSIAANTNTLSIYLEGFSYGVLILSGVFFIIQEIREFILSLKSIRGSLPNASLLHMKKNSLSAILIASLYPCPGAILVLVLSFTLKLLNLGIISVAAMSLGMAVPILAAAYLAWAGRRGVFALLKKNIKLSLIASFAIEMFGYAMLLAFSLYISWPFWLSLFR